MAELNITFAGIITHLDGIVPGVPMRAVVPNALSVRFGEIWIPDLDTPQLRKREYYLMPHVAYIQDRRPAGPAKACGLPQVVNGSYLKIVNAKGERLHFAHKGGFSLSEFVHDVQLDDDVCFEGNAACYFDIFHGCAWTEGKGNEPRTTRVRMETEGTPRLAIAAMPGSGPDSCGDYYEVEIPTNELYVSNLDYDPATEYRNFDFLMNYLVAKGGIPRVLTKPTPGMPRDPAGLTMKYLGEKLKALGEFIKTDSGTVKGYRAAGGSIGGSIKNESLSEPPTTPPNAGQSSLSERLSAGVQDPVPLDQSCSDSHFP